jgi:hypothetical protein
MRWCASSPTSLAREVATSGHTASSSSCESRVLARRAAERNGPPASDHPTSAAQSLSAGRAASCSISSCWPIRSARMESAAAIQPRPKPPIAIASAVGIQHRPTPPSGSGRSNVSTMATPYTRYARSVFGVTRWSARTSSWSGAGGAARRAVLIAAACCVSSGGASKPGVAHSPRTGGARPTISDCEHAPREVAVRRP